MKSGEHWRRVRSAMSPVFSTSKLRKMSLNMEAAVNELVQHLHSVTQKEQSVEVYDLFQQLTLKVIGT